MNNDRPMATYLAGDSEIWKKMNPEERRRMLRNIAQYGINPKREGDKQTFKVQENDPTGIQEEIKALMETLLLLVEKIGQLVINPCEFAESILNIINDITGKTLAEKRKALLEKAKS